jgi:chromosome segregation ATPase
MTISEKIKEKKARIAAAQERIGKEQEKISKYRRELETLESLEVKAMLKEIDMPLDQVKELLKNMKTTPTQSPGSANE